MSLDASLRRAKEILYWPRMSDDIRDVLERCQACNSFKKSPAKEPLIEHEIPEIPWQKVGTDIFHCNGNDYLLLVDYFSDFIEVV